MGLGLTVCVTCVWAGVDSVWEQEKLEAEKCPKMPHAKRPTRRVHALLGNHEPAKTLAIKKAQSLTDKLAP